MKLLLIIGVALSIGCESKEQTLIKDKEMKAYREEVSKRVQAGFDQCAKLGGVPIKSSWDHTLKRCDFPNRVKQSK